MAESAEAFEAILGLIVGGFILMVFAAASPPLAVPGIGVLGVIAILAGVVLGVILVISVIASLLN